MHRQRRRRWWTTAALAMAVSLLVPAGRAQGEPAEIEEQAAPVVVSPESPRAAITRFLELCRHDDFDSAGAWLDVPVDQAKLAPTLARRLKAVLDRHVWFDLEQISPEAEGDLEDDLSEWTEQVGSVAVEGGASEPVRLSRQPGAEPGQPAWVFSRSTVQRIDTWYEALPNRWALELLPDVLRRPGPAELLWWQWLALPVLIVLAWVGGFIAGRISHGFLNRLAKRTASEWDDVILDRIDGPLTWAWTILIAYALVPLLALYQPAEDFIHRVLRAGLFVVFFWSLLRAIDVIAEFLVRTPWAEARPASRSLLPLGGRIAKVLVFVMAVIAVLSDFGFPIASLMAGLGVGGLAIGLAGKSTVENLFGAFAIGVDQPLRVGDFVKVDDFVGTVESIGLRSTRIRTLDRTTISLPNGTLADKRIETFATRDRVRLNTTIGVEYGTTAEQMKQVLEGCERVLREHPKTWPDNVVVRFAGFGDSSLNIEIICWFLVPDYNGFREVRQEVLLGIMQVVEGAGTAFAFPTRTLHVVNESGPTPSGPTP